MKPAYTVMKRAPYFGGQLSESVDCCTDQPAAEAHRIAADIPQDSGRWLPGPVPTPVGRPPVEPMKSHGI